MKKIIAILSAAVLSAGILSAQDFAKATDLAKQANESLLAGDFTTAISNFEAALAQASNCVEEGAPELVANCQKGIVQAKNAAVNPLIEGGQWKEAVAQLDDVIATAGNFGDEEMGQKAADKKLQVLQAAANAEIKATKGETDPAAKAAHFQSAIEFLDGVLAIDPANGKALMSKGQVLTSLGKADEAIEVYTKAKECGQESSANKQIANIYVKKASALLKAQKYKEAAEAAVKATEFNEKNANAFKIAGIASQKSGNLQGAVDYLGKYLEINPGDEQIAKAVEAIKANIKK